MEKTYRSQIRPLQMEMTVLLPVLPSAEKELAIILDFERSWQRRTGNNHTGDRCR